MKALLRSSLFLAVLGLFSFATSDTPEPQRLLKDPRLMANAWFAFSAEKSACYLQTYRLAMAELPNRLKANAKSGKKAAIVTDLDETALDNSAWALRVMLEGTDYPTYWAEWEKAGVAPAFPGAVAFFQKAKALGIPVFYISNRKAENLDGTIRNLRNLGFPNADSAHIMLKTTTSNKVARRAEVLKNHNIIMLLGDNLADFDGAWEEAPAEKRGQLVLENEKNWGRKFIVFPNPTYGSWKDALMNYNRKLSQPEQDSLWKQHIQTYLKVYKF